VLAVSRVTRPCVDAWAEGRELWFGAAVIASVLIAFVGAMRIARRTAPAPIRL
jgi:hypothetical protein